MGRTYQTKMIKPILKVIEKKQDYLCQPENLPQLAKLGFMFNTLWYSGRAAFGFHGLVKKGNSCENNPKYELGDTIEYNSAKNDSLIYDAWGMHVSNDDMSFSYDDFRKIVLEGKELSVFEKECRKQNKTFDDWVKVLTDKRYEYSSMYPDRKSVADHLLCVIGNGYGYNEETGMVIEEASGADQDIDGYGEWENAVFEPSILKVVNKILEDPDCKVALDAYHTHVINYKEEQKRAKKEKEKKFWGKILPGINEKLVEAGREPIDIDSDDVEDAIDRYLTDFIEKNKDKLPEIAEEVETPEETYRDYYPISDNFSIITKFDEKTHPSYIQAGIEICEDIVAHPPKPRKDFNEYQKKENDYQVVFATNFLKKWKNNLVD